LPWAVILTPAFRRDCGSLSREILERVETALQELANSEEPQKLGHRLHGRWQGLCSYEIGRQYRIVYRVKFDDKVIEFLAAGTHKVYRWPFVVQYIPKNEVHFLSHAL